MVLFLIDLSNCVLSMISFFFPSMSFSFFGFLVLPRAVFEILSASDRRGGGEELFEREVNQREILK